MVQEKVYPVYLIAGFLDSGKTSFINGILSDGFAMEDHTLLLQPQTRAEVLRAFLAENGYAIRREALVEDRGVLYPVMEAGGGKMSLTLGQLHGGAALLHDPLGERYIIQKIIRLQTAVAGINRSGKGLEKADRLREIITALLSMREEWVFPVMKMHRCSMKTEAW